ncbi:MAG: phosphohistidine phosphatase SixA [Acidobacteria bacterium]|nr:phosphohistidine phosphatase SixA [Acidobacteriota bacterium]MCL5289298.1 phosphohistidine phosphatase SixA [Acidobacteriota bacterium]
MLLYLMRHGIAIDREDPECPPDPERYLTKKGREKTREVAMGLRALGVRPEAMLSSPYVRAVQTAEIAAEVLGFSRDKIRQTESLLFERKPNELFRELARVRAKEVMCFGHAPHLDEVIALALGSRGNVTALKKAGVACLELKAVSPPRGILLWLCAPRTLRALGE